MFLHSNHFRLGLKKWSAVLRLTYLICYGRLWVFSSISSGWMWSSQSRVDVREFLGKFSSLLIQRVTRQHEHGEISFFNREKYYDLERFYIFSVRTCFRSHLSIHIKHQKCPIADVWDIAENRFCPFPTGFRMSFNCCSTNFCLWQSIHYIRKSCIRKIGTTMEPAHAMLLFSIMRK